MADPSKPADAGESQSNTGEMWGTMATMSLSISFLVQMASGVIAMYYIQEVVHQHSDELAKHRKEHEAIAALTRREAEFVMIYNDVCCWRKLSQTLRATVLASTVCFLLSLFILQFMDQDCFRDFAISSRICDSFDDQGLEGNVLNLIKPMGVVAHIGFFIACGLHTFFLKWVGRTARQALAERKNKADAVPDATLAVLRRGVSGESSVSGHSHGSAGTQRRQVVGGTSPRMVPAVPEDSVAPTPADPRSQI